MSLNVRRALVFALALWSGAGVADEIHPVDGAVFRLGNTPVETFYVPMVDGFRVVALAQTADAQVFRFTATLRPGEQATLALPHGLGERVDEVTFVRTGNRVRIERAAAAAIN